MIRVARSVPREVRLQLHHWRHWRRYEKRRSRGGRYSFLGLEKHRCLFVHVPKTGGVSVCRALFGDLGPGHLTITAFKKIYGPFALRGYFTFGFVRDPFTRLRSAFNFLSAGGMGSADEEWRLEHLDGIDSFEDFVMGWLNDEAIWKGVHLHPQSHFLCDDRGRVDVDFVGRFERLDQDFAFVARRLGVGAQLGRENASPPPRSPLEYTPEMRVKVARLYARDLRVFDYPA